MLLRIKEQKTKIKNLFSNGELCQEKNQRELYLILQMIDAIVSIYR